MNQTALWAMIDVRLEKYAFRAELPWRPINQERLGRADRTMADLYAWRTGSSHWQGHGWGARLAALLSGRRRRQRHARLDERTLPDHLKRDMGFLDGNDPAGRGA
jgi:hypothetical protein